jgi:hypothetical protein
MKQPEGDELANWINDVSNLSGKEIIVLKREERLISTQLAEKLLLVTVIIALTFAVSATYYLAAPQSAISTTTTIAPTSTSSTTSTSVTTKPTTTEAVTTTTEPVEPTVEETTATTEPIETLAEETEETTTTTELTTSTTESTTTTTLTSAQTMAICGGDLEFPCIYANGPKCDPGMVLGADEICHKKTHSYSVTSGLEGDGCSNYVPTVEKKE